MATPMTSGQHGWRVFKKILDELFWQNVRAVEKQSLIPLVFDQRSSDSQYEEVQGYSGISGFPQWNEAEVVSYKSINARFLSTFTHVKYGAGIQYSRELRDDNKYGLMEEAASEFGIAAAIAKEDRAAYYFYDGFTTSWNSTDAVPLFSASHNLVTGSTCSNLTTGALSQTTYKTAVELLWNTKDENGDPMPFEPDLLVVTSGSLWEAEKIMASVDDPDTTDRATNVVRRLAKARVVNWPFLRTYSTTAWLLFGRRAGSTKRNTIWYTRMPLETVLDEDKEAQVLKHFAGERYSYGAKDWRGVVGSLGT